MTWINLDGIHNLEYVEKIGQKFDLHPLVLEDIVNTGQRPKVEDFSNYLYVVVRMLDYDDKRREINSEQVSLIIGSNFVISFQEKEGDVFDFVRERIRQNRGRIRKSGPDYLFYTLIDAIVDNYFIVLEKMGERIETQEEQLILKPLPRTMNEIHLLKREMILLRKSVWPLREVISGIERLDIKLISKTTDVFLRDVYDHTIQVIDTVETFRDMVSGMLDTYLSSVSNRMNEVMKVLTIIATIFIPLTFIAGIYGMNFQYMPELGWHFGYFAVVGVMVIIFVGMLFYFKKKKWI
jgi:magnesium transporter